MGVVLINRKVEGTKMSVGRVLHLWRASRVVLRAAPTCVSAGIDVSIVWNVTAKGY